MKKFIYVTLFAMVILYPAFSQETREPGTGRFFDERLSVTLDFSLSIMKYESKTYSDRDIRPTYEGSNYDYKKFNPGPTETDFEDVEVSVAYEDEKFGGKVALTTGGMTGISAWIRFIPQIKLTAGMDIDASYADDLDADPGLRIYDYSGNDVKNHWSDSVDMDNISADGDRKDGLLLEGFLGPVNLAAAASFNDVLSEVFKKKPGHSTEGELTVTREWQYGARIGSGLGRWGKLNASYIIHYNSYADRYGYDTQGTFVAKDPRAEVYKHIFGIFASLTPLEKLGLTVGWGGIVIDYLDEFCPSGNTTVETVWPMVLKNGFNLNARYTGIPRFTLRTDNNFSFWTDKDYSIFDISPYDAGVLSMAAGNQYANVEHWLLWNGLGVYYSINDQLTVGVYVRNLLRSDTAKDYIFTRNELVVEPKVTWKLNENIEFYAAFNYTIMIDTMSRELNRVNKTGFIAGKTPVETTDMTQEFKIPLGFTIKI